MTYPVDNTIACMPYPNENSQLTIAVKKTKIHNNDRIKPAQIFLWLFFRFNNNKITTTTYSVCVNKPAISADNIVEDNVSAEKKNKTIMAKRAIFFSTIKC